MKLFNTLSGKKEEFHFMPGKKNEIGMYVCGPTVYDVGHLGHARSAVAFDVIRRYFQFWKGWKVTFVSNYTDVDDKMIKRAEEEGITEKELAVKIIPEYQKDYGALKVLPPDHQPRATEYIPHMVELIEKLLNKGVAYVADDGVYFEVNKFKEYGKLSHQKLDELQAGARIAVDEKKKNPEDFALWKKEKPGEPAWNGPRGMKGRPGWHIECSAMSAKLLGETFDIHGGGIDLQFPHHEDEIAQSEMANGKPFARYWLHNGHIQIHKEKMSKSLGNFFTIKDIFKKYNPLVVRYFLISTHYRMPIEFSDGLLEQAKASLSRFHDFIRRIHNAPVSKDGFDYSYDSDFERSPALASIFHMISFVNAELDNKNGLMTPSTRDALLKMVSKFDSVLEISADVQKFDKEIEDLIVRRNEARASRNYALADQIRVALQSKGIELDDTKNGTVWKKIL